MFSFQTLTHSSHLVQVRIFTAVGFTYEVLMMSPTSFWTGAVILDQLHWLMEPEDTNANVLSGAELRTNNWRAPRFCFCETYTHRRNSLNALTRDLILIWPLDLRPLETWTTAEPWFLIADDTQWTALVRDPTNQPTETIKTGSMSTVSIQHDCAEFIRQLIRRIDGVGAWNDRPGREEGRTCSFNSKKSHESSFESSCNWDFKLRPDYGDCQGGRAETYLHVVSLMVKIVIIKKWEYVGSFFFGDDCTRHFSASVSHLRCQKLSAQQSADAITLCVSGRLEIQRHH